MMMQLVVASVIGLLAVVALAIAICWLWDRVTRGPWSQEEYDRRLLNPDFAALERHFECTMPQAIREFYADSELILKSDFLIRSRNAPEVEEFDIACFVPADAEQMETWWPPAERKFIIANSVCGDPYYVELPLTQPNPLPVYVLYHDGGDTFNVADSLEEFMELCRGARPFD